ncbi:MAG: DUF2520 domain-containing protein [Smithellaceae bacterium]|nr:DUF2520 domain-containing protein [Smithellaceae bacterium]
MTKTTMRRGVIALIGAGKVGTAVGILLHQKRHRIGFVYDPFPGATDQLSATTGAMKTASAAEAAAGAEIIFITTPDDVIGACCRELAAHGVLEPGTKVVHVSGAGGLALLESASQSGAAVASIHPIQSFSDVESAIRDLPGSTFGITADEEIIPWVMDLVSELGGRPLLVTDEDKPLYHAAACMASNYLTTLIDLVQQIYQKIGMNEDESLEVFWPLVVGTLRNIEKNGTVASLTGPIARGDKGTVKAHIDILRDRLPAFVDLYCHMGQATVDLALKKGLSPERAQEINALLQGGRK